MDGMNDESNKKPKIVTDLNNLKKERKNKYFWPKIDVENKPTPKPVTPKPVTPKPVRKKSAKDISNSTPCKRVLNFNNDDLNIDPGFNTSSCNVQELKVLGLNSKLSSTILEDHQPILEPKTPTPASRESRKNYVESEDHATADQSLRVVEKATINKVYKRRLFKCLSTCRKLGVDFNKSRRKLRHKKSIEAINQLEGFNKFEIVPAVLDKINILRCEKTRILPMKEKFVPELFNCVLNLISSSITLRKRSRKSRRKRRNLMKICAQVSGGESSKMEPKQKKRRVLKSKTKRADYLRGVTDWNDRSLEQIIDALILQFKSMELYDNPKTLERWSVQFDHTEGVDAEHVNLKWEEEKLILLGRLANFVYLMTQCQGRKEFIKWNGSVLDSVIGVFLTQNVSDFLSSNAFMKLASQYPIKVESETNNNPASSRSTTPNVVIEHPEDQEYTQEKKDFDDALNEMFASQADLKMSKKQAENAEKIDWESIRVRYAKKGERKPEAQDSVDWEAVRNAPVEDISEVINGRGQHNVIAAKIQNTLNRLYEDHRSLDLEWLREAPPQVAKAYLLSFYGLGLKSVECLRLLTLHHHGFPVDVNIARIVIRLGLVPIKQLPVGMEFHRLEKLPLEREIQQFLWPYLKNVAQKILYTLHCHMITFGKVFCTKRNPNCKACPFKGGCKYYESVCRSRSKLALQNRRDGQKSKKGIKRIIPNPFDKRETCHSLRLSAENVNSSFPVSPLSSSFSQSKKCDPIVEMPSSPSPEEEPKLTDMEDLFSNEVEEEIPNIKLNTEVFAQLLKTCFEKSDMPLEGNDHSSSALVILSSEDASMPLPKHTSTDRLRTEHQVYELPDSHPLLKDIDRRDEKDPLPYLLAIWMPDDFMKECGVTTEESCFTSQADDSSTSTVPATLLIPSRTALRGFFPLNGTYFQMNEVFVDDETSHHPLNVPRNLLWSLRRRRLYCGSSTTSIFKGLTSEEIQRCCCEGFVCVRAFDRETRAPKPLSSRFLKHQKEKVFQK